MTLGCRNILLGFMMLFTFLFAGCGGGSGSTGGAGVISSSGSLALAVDKTSVAAGADSITATVTLTSLLSQPVNGVSVTVDVTYNGIVLASTSGNTNTNGVAVIALPVAMVASDRVYYLQARSNGVTSSSTVAVTVKAPVLSTTIPTSTTKSAVEGTTIEYVLQGDTVSFKDGSGNPFAGTTIIFTLNSQTGSNGQLLRNGMVLNTTTNNTFSVVTDSTGTANTGITAVLTAGAADTSAVTTFYYTLSATAAGQTFTKQNSSQFTLTATAAPAPPAPAALTLSPTTLTFAAADAINTTKIVTISGGTAPYTVTSGAPADISATVAGTSITVSNRVTGPGTNQAAVTVNDASGLSSTLIVTYAK